MLDPIVNSLHAVTLVGGGTLGDDDLALAISLAPVPVGVDGGAGVLLSRGLDPVAVIGDFDSLSAENMARIPASRLHRIREQDSTDFDKALRNVRAPAIVAVGFLGGRIDHQLAVLNALVREPAQRCILLGETEIILHVPPNLAIELPAGEIVSLFPMAPVTGQSRGLHWPIDGLLLKPDGRVATSNVSNGPVKIETDGPGLLIILPRTAIAAVMQSFS